MQGHKDEAIFQNRMGGSARDANDAKADTGASQYYWTHRDVKALTNIMPLINGPDVKLPDSTIIQATHPGTIPLHPTLSEQAQQAHTFPKMTNSSL
eukprot:6925449-Ditylum_brightwellii.AAC.1